MSGTAVVEAPVQKQAPQQEAKQPSMSERFKQAHAKSVAAGGVDGIVTDFQKIEAAKANPPQEQQKQEIKQEVKVDPSKGEEKKEEVKQEEKKQDEGLFDSLKKIGDEDKSEAKKEEVDVSKLSKEEKAENSYRKLRQERDAFEKELKDIKEKVGDTDVAALKKQLADLEKLASEREQRLAALDVTESPQFKENVVEPCNKILQSLSDASKKYGFSWKEFANSMDIESSDDREAALDKLFSSSETDMPNVTKLRLLNMTVEYLQRQEYGKQILSDAKKARDVLNADKEKAERESKEKAESDYKRISSLVFDHITGDKFLEAMPFLATEKDGKLSLNEEKAGLLRRQLEVGREVPTQTRALQILSEAILPMAIEENKTLRSKQKELEDRIAKLTNTSPQMEGGRQEGGEKAGDDDGTPLSEKLKKIRMGR